MVIAKNKIIVTAIYPQGKADFQNVSKVDHMLSLVSSYVWSTFYWSPRYIKL